MDVGGRFLCAHCALNHSPYPARSGVRFGVVRARLAVVEDGDSIIPESITLLMLVVSSPFQQSVDVLGSASQKVTP